MNESRENRIFKLCDMNCIEDQLHFMFYCPLYYMYRNELYIKARTAIPEWDNLPDCEKLCYLFAEIPRRLGKYVKNSFILRRRTIYE